MTSRRRQSGFTLIEILLALGMIATLSLSLYASLHVALQARKGTTAALEPVRAAQIAMDLVRRDLENALPPTQNSTNIPVIGPFVGQPAGASGLASDTLDYFCMGHASAAGDIDPTEAGGVQRIELGLSQSADKKGFVLERRIYGNLLAAQDVDPRVEVLCRNVHSLLILYFDGSSWTDTWDSTQESNILPVAVQVTLEIDGAKRGPETPAPYRMSRVILLPCHADATSTSTSTTTGGTP